MFKNIKYLFSNKSINIELIKDKPYDVVYFERIFNGNASTGIKVFAVQYIATSSCKFLCLEELANKNLYIAWNNASSKLAETEQMGVSRSFSLATLKEFFNVKFYKTMDDAISDKFPELLKKDQ